jgi:hypothetical protein
MSARIRAIKFGVFAGFLLICAPNPSSAAELTNETSQAWQDYIRSAHSGIEERIHGTGVGTASLTALGYRRSRTMDRLASAGYP